MKKVNFRTEFLKEVLAIIGEKCYAVEIGVLNGDFSQMILYILNPRSLHLIDPFETSKKKYLDGLTTAYSTEIEYENVLKRFRENKNVIINREYSYNANPGYFSKSIDFIYIDASHLYEDVKRDLNDWLPKLKSGGILAGHDYITLNDFGVIQAVDEFCIENNFEMVILNTNGGDWALKRK